MKINKGLLAILLVSAGVLLAACSSNGDDEKAKETAKTYSLAEAKEVLNETIDKLNTDSRILNDKLVTTHLSSTKLGEFTDEAAFYVNDLGKVEKVLMDYETQFYSFIYKDNTLYEVDGEEKKLTEYEKSTLKEFIDGMFDADYRQTSITPNLPELNLESDKIVKAEEVGDNYVFTFESKEGLAQIAEFYETDVNTMNQRISYTFNNKMELQAFSRTIKSNDGETLWSEESTVKDYKW